MRKSILSNHSQSWLPGSVEICLEEILMHIPNSIIKRKLQIQVSISGLEDLLGSLILVTGNVNIETFTHSSSFGILQMRQSLSQDSKGVSDVSTSVARVDSFC